MSADTVNGLPADLMRACARPAAELTDDDLGILADWDPTAAAERRAAREQAIATARAAAERAAQTARATVPAAASYARLPALPDASTVADPDALAAWVEQHALAAVPLAIWHGFLAANREKREALERRIEALERRLAELAERPAVSYRGVWRDGEPYAAGDFVTHAGSMWYARTASISRRPGTDAGASAWQLAVKRGSDAKGKT